MLFLSVEEIVDSLDSIWRRVTVMQLIHITKIIYAPEIKKFVDRKVYCYDYFFFSDEYAIYAILNFIIDSLFFLFLKVVRKINYQCNQ